MADNAFPYLTYYQNLLISKKDWIKYKAFNLFNDMDETYMILFGEVKSNKNDFYTLYFDSNMEIRIYKHYIALHYKKILIFFEFSNMKIKNIKYTQRYKDENKMIHDLFQTLLFFLDKHTVEINKLANHRLIYFRYLQIIKDLTGYDIKEKKKFIRQHSREAFINATQIIQNIREGNV